METGGSKEFKKSHMKSLKSHLVLALAPDASQEIWQECICTKALE